MADDLQAQINVLERAIYAINYASCVTLTVEQNIARVNKAAEMTRTLETLKRQQSQQIQQRWEKLAPIGGQRLGTGELAPPELPEPATSDYDPYRRAAEEFGWSYE